VNNFIKKKRCKDLDNSKEEHIFAPHFKGNDGHQGSLGEWLKPAVC
jgi:hypothetical protein